MKSFAVLIVVLSVYLKDSYQKKVCVQDPASDLRARSAQVIQLVGDASTFVNRPADKAAVESTAVEIFTKYNISCTDKSKTTAEIAHDIVEQLAGNGKILADLAAATPLNSSATIDAAFSLLQLILNIVQSFEASAMFNDPDFSSAPESQNFLADIANVLDNITFYTNDPSHLKEYLGSSELVDLANDTITELVILFANYAPPSTYIRARVAEAIPLVGDFSTFVNRTADMTAVEAIVVELLNKYQILFTNKSVTVEDGTHDFVQGLAEKCKALSDLVAATDLAAANQTEFALIGYAIILIFNQVGSFGSSFEVSSNIYDSDFMTAPDAQNFVTAFTNVYNNVTYYIQNPATIDQYMRSEDIFDLANEAISETFILFAQWAKNRSTLIFPFKINETMLI